MGAWRYYFLPEILHVAENILLKVYKCLIIGKYVLRCKEILGSRIIIAFELPRRNRGAQDHDQGYGRSYRRHCPIFRSHPFLPVSERSPFSSCFPILNASMDKLGERRTLSPAHSAALFDLLSHSNVYSEIRDFRRPGSLEHYGPPFTIEEEKPSSSPALQGLVSKFLLNLPGLKDVPEEFWKVQLHDIIEALENANLSESYDKGVVGTRKTVATAISALVEYPVRGTFGGFSKVQDPDHNYDLSNAEDLQRAFRNLMDASIYGIALDDLIEKTAETDKLVEHDSMIQAAHEFVLVK